MAHRIRRRRSLTSRLARRAQLHVRRKRAAKKRQQAAAAKAWTTVPARGVKVPRAKGGGRIQPWSASEATIMQAKATLKAQNRKPKPVKPVKDPGPGFQVVTIKHGTNAGYHAHLEHKSPACPACLKAHADYNRVHR